MMSQTRKADRANRRFRAGRYALSLVLPVLAGLASPVAASAQSPVLGRETDTEIVFDTALPADFAAAITAADPRTARFAPLIKRSTRTVDGTPQEIATVEIAWDNDMIANGQFAFVSPTGVSQDSWAKADPASPAWQALVPVLKAAARAEGTWRYVTVRTVRRPDGAAAARAPLTPSELAVKRMARLGTAIVPGRFFPGVKAPADLRGMQQAMLDYGNYERRDPAFRKRMGAKTVTDLSLDTVTTLGGREKVFRQNPAPPYFTDVALDDRLNQAAQMQAECQAMMRRQGHDCTIPYRDPKTGAAANVRDLGARAAHFGVQSIVEAAGYGALGNFPVAWMKGDTHFRPWFEVDGRYPQIGFGAALGGDGNWYYAAVPVRHPDGVVPGGTPAPAPVTRPATPPQPASPAPPAPAPTPPAPTAPAPATNQGGSGLLARGEVMLKGSRYAMNGHYLTHQRDGNLCVYATPGDRWTWCINNDPAVPYQRIDKVQLTLDGRLVALDAAGATVWQTPVAGDGIHLTAEGALELRGSRGRARWSNR